MFRIACRFSFWIGCSIVNPVLFFPFVKMFGRILVMQQNEYGNQDRRCYVTIDKIKMVESQGQKFEMAVEELRRTFSMPQTVAQSVPEYSAPPVIVGEDDTKFKPNLVSRSQSVPATTKGKGKGVFKGVMKSIRKKKT